MAKKRSEEKRVELKPMEDQPVDRNPHIDTKLVLDQASLLQMFEMFHRPVECFDIVRLDEVIEGQEGFCSGLAWGAVAKGGVLQLKANLAGLPFFAKMQQEPGPDDYVVIEKAA